MAFTQSGVGRAGLLLYKEGESQLDPYSVQFAMARCNRFFHCAGVVLCMMMALAATGTCARLGE